MADRNPSDLERTVRRRYTELFEKNKTVEAVFKRIRQGRATYKDASIFAEEIGTILSEILTDLDLTSIDVNDLVWNVLGNALNQNISLSNLVCESVQSTLNEAAEIGLNPVAPALNVSRIKDLQKAAAEATDENALFALLNEPVITNVMSNVDDWVKTNADFQAEAGLDPIIVRTWSGSFPSHDTKHTDWCKRLAGTWEYGDEPQGVYRRHTGCKCVVEYFPNKKAKGRITALTKGEKDTEHVLWNTGKFTSTKRRAVLEQRRKIYGRDEARRILNEEWKGGLNGNAERHFT